MRVKTLLIEDDAKTAAALKRGLEAEGFEATIAVSGEEGFFLLSKESFDVVVLDWMLPQRDGVEILKTARARGVKTPVLLLTARDAVEDRVLGLESGADDYLVKPFAFTELVARLRALLRRAGNDETPRAQIADLSLDLQTRRASRAEREIALTPREFELLAYLLRNAGQTVSRAMIARDVWCELNRATPLNNVIDVHLAHLRRKVDNGHTLRLIHTVRGVGFILKPEIAA